MAANERGSLDDSVGRLLSLLHAVFPSAMLPTFRQFLLEMTGAQDVGVLLADYDLITLRPLIGSQSSFGDSSPVEDSDAGAAFITQAPIVVPEGDGVRVYVPVTLRAERIGVLDVVLPGPADRDVLQTLQRAGLLLGYLLPTLGMYTDVIERARRERPLTLPAEVQWSMLPVKAYECPEFSIAGQLVPAYEVGGDLFDYAIEPAELTVTVTDAMGHGVNASLLGALAVSALRNARRTGLALADQVRSADRLVHGQFGSDQFVTALAMRLDMATGCAQVVNAGHPPPYLLRQGQVSQLKVPPDLPMGLVETTLYREHSVQLQPGDRLLLFTDGVLEAPSPWGEPFGALRLEGLLMGAIGTSPGETVRHMVRALREWQGDEMRDDATAVCLDWRRTSGQEEREPRVDRQDGEEERTDQGVNS